MHHVAPSPRKLAKAELPLVSPNSADKYDDENQTHLQAARFGTRRLSSLRAQCCYVMIDRVSVQLTCETEAGPSRAKTAVALLHCALARRQSQQIRKSYKDKR
jgi:hypothetical protein